MLSKKFFFVFLVYIKMLEITRKNWYKCDLETIILNGSQYFWINLKAFEVETKCNWQNIFNKHGNSSTLKYRKELTPDIQFQPDKIFTRNDLFERIIKSCKATNVEFLMLKEKLGLCPYEVICNEEDFILIPEIQDDIKELKRENKEPKEIKISEESAEELKEIKISEKDKNVADWYDKNNFKKILAIINNNKFNHKNKIGEFRYSNIKDLVDNINKNIISEILARKNLNALNEIKKAEIKNRRLLSSQKELLNLFNNLFNAISSENNNNNNGNNNNTNINTNINTNND